MSDLPPAANSFGPVRILQDVTATTTMDELADLDQYVSAAKAGDGDAWDAICAILLDPVYRFVRARLDGPRAEVEDVVQETFLAIVRGLGRYRGDGRFFAWCLAIARQRIAAQFRSRRRSRRVEPDLARVAKSLDCEALPPEAIERAELCGLVARAVTALPPDQGRILRLKYGEGLPFRDLATRTGRTESAVKSLVMRAKTALREALRGEVGGDR